jgi:hypothetical protein
MTVDFATILLIVFGVLGFGANLFVRVIFVYEDLKNGEEINWWWQFLYTFAVPLICVFAIFESMLALGFFSSQPAVFDFTKQER